MEDVERRDQPSDRSRRGARNEGRNSPFLAPLASFPHSSDQKEEERKRQKLERKHCTKPLHRRAFAVWAFVAHSEPRSFFLSRCHECSTETGDGASALTSVVVIFKTSANCRCSGVSPSSSGSVGCALCYPAVDPGLGSAGRSTSPLDLETLPLTLYSKRIYLSNSRHAATATSTTATTGGTGREGTYLDVDLYSHYSERHTRS